jgi:hypothetical protein
MLIINKFQSPLDTGNYQIVSLVDDKSLPEITGLVNTKRLKH